MDFFLRSRLILSLRIFTWLLLLIPFSSHASVKPNKLRLIISSGTHSSHFKYRDFYSSKIFESNTVAPFIISSANGVGLIHGQGYFYFPQPISDSQLQALSKKKISVAKPKKMPGFNGHSFFGPMLDDAKLENLEEVKQYLGAANDFWQIQKLKANGIEFWWFNRGQQRRKLNAPKDFSQLARVPVAGVVFGDGKKNAIFIAKSIGDLANKFGIIDKLMAKKTVNSAYLDIGSDYIYGGQKNYEFTKKLIEKRKPVVLGSGTFELGLSQKSKTYLSPLNDANNKKIILGKKIINFWSVAGSEPFWQTYAKKNKIFNLQKAQEAWVKNIKAPKKDLSIVLARSNQTAQMVSGQASQIDLILTPVLNANIKLASREKINLKGALTDGYRQNGPVVSISDAEVTEIILTLKSEGEISGLEIIRHHVDQFAPIASDVVINKLKNSPAGLPPVAEILPQKKSWSEAEFDAVSGGLLIEETKSNIALIEKSSRSTKINSGLSFEASLEKLSRPGVVSVFETSGKQLKEIANIAASNGFNFPIAIFGMDKNGRKFHNRSIAPNEKYRVAVTEKVLYELLGLSRIGGLQDEMMSRALFVETIYADMKALYFMGGPKRVTFSKTKTEIALAVANIRLGKPVRAIVESSLQSNKFTDHKLASFIKYPSGEPNHALTLDIRYLDIGISKNAANSVYGDWQDDKNIKLPMGRGNVPPFAHLFLFYKIALIYDMPHLVSTLWSDLKYMQTNLDGKPEKDKLKVGLKFRLPWERSYFKDSAVSISPIIYNTYETKIAPFTFLSDNTTKDWENLKMLPRVKRDDTFLGVDINFKKLGARIEVGGLMAVNFNRPSGKEMIDFGPGLNFFGSWNLFGPMSLQLDFNSYYVFPLSDTIFPDKLAYGIEGVARLVLARINNFSVALLSDFMAVALQQNPKEIGLSSIFGLTVSYGGRFRFF